MIQYTQIRTGFIINMNIWSNMVIIIEWLDQIVSKTINSNVI